MGPRPSEEAEVVDPSEEVEAEAEAEVEAADPREEAEAADAADPREEAEAADAADLREEEEAAAPARSPSKYSSECDNLCQVMHLYNPTSGAVIGHSSVHLIGQFISVQPKNDPFLQVWCILIGPSVSEPPLDLVVDSTDALSR